MKVEIDNSGIHLRAMRDTMDELRTFMAGYQAGQAAAGGGAVTVFAGMTFHLGQIRILLNEVMRQVEAAEAKTNRK